MEVKLLALWPSLHKSRGSSLFPVPAHHGIFIFNSSLNVYNPLNPSTSFHRTSKFFLFAPLPPFTPLDFINPRATHAQAMSEPLETPWSSHPNAPQISSSVYIQEKEGFAGLSIGLITYGALTHTPAHLCSLCLFDPHF